MMKNQVAFSIALAAGLSLASGCTSTSARPSWSRPFQMFSAKSSDDATAVATDETPKVSEEFKAAQKILKKDPEGTILAYARLKEDNEEYAEARDRYREMLIAYPQNIDARLGLARIELKTGRSQQAEQILQSLDTDHPNNLAVQRQLGQMFVQREDWDSAARILESACEHHPEDQTAAYELGLVYTQRNEMKKAMDCLAFAVGESAAMYNVGYVLYEQGRTAEAARWFQDALQNHPDERTAHQSQQMLTRVNAVLSRDGLGSQLAMQPDRSRRTAFHSNSGVSPTGSSVHSDFHAASWSSSGVSSANMSSSPGTSQGQRTASEHGPSRVAPVRHVLAAPTPAISGTAAGQPTSTDTASVPQWGGPAPAVTSPSVVGGRSAATMQQAPFSEPPGWRSK